MKESVSVRFLYQTVPGRMMLKVLTAPEVSKIGGRVLSTKASKIAIPYFIKKHQISMGDVIVPEQGFSSFNAFFSRKRKEKFVDTKETTLYSPCDAYLSAMKIHKDQLFDVKHTRFSVDDLLQDKKLAEEYQDGMALIFRLTPSHYHRYSYGISGQVTEEKKIPGILHCVRPIVTGRIPVFVQNARQYQVIETNAFGKVVQMEVGALLVGKIRNHKRLQNEFVTPNDEKGYFQFGGSTIIMLFKKDQLKLKRSLLTQKIPTGELMVRKGMEIGRHFQK